MTLRFGRTGFECVLAALLSVGCGKFQQARECATFVKTVNRWLASSAAKNSAIPGSSSEPKQIASEARATAQHYADLSRSLAELHVQAEELVPRVKRYEDIADNAARTLREVADSLDRGELEKARQARVGFDTVAQREAPLIQEINAVCR